MDSVTRTFRAPNMLQALQQIQQELGADAIVISMRKVPSGPAWQVWRTPMVEVIATKKSSRKTKSKDEFNTRSPKENIQSNTQDEAQEEEIPFIEYTQSIKPKKRKPPPEIEQPTEKQKRDVKLDSSVAFTIQTLVNQQQKKKTQEWKPFVPPQVSSSHQEDAGQKNGKNNSTPGIEKELTELSEHQLSAKQLVMALPEIRKRINVASRLPKTLSYAMDNLQKQGIEEQFTLELISTCQDVLPLKAQEDEKRIRHLLQRQLEAEIRVLKNEEIFSPKTLFLIGSAGSGKTSSCAKMATHGKHTFNKEITWICADTVRTGAIAEARMYTELINIPIQMAYTPDELEKIVYRGSKFDWILVDTADCNPRSEASVVDLGNFVTQIPVRSTFVVLSATTKENDLNQSLAAYKPFRIKGLIITKMDEAITFGNVYNIARKSQIPIAFFTSGNHVINDLHTASVKQFVDSLFGEGFAQ